MPSNKKLQSVSSQMVRRNAIYHSRLTKMINLEDISIGDIIVLDIDPELSYKNAQGVICQHDTMNFLHGTVDSYDIVTGVLCIKILFIYGIETASTWSINMKDRPIKNLDRYCCRLDEFINLNALKCGDRKDHIFRKKMLLTAGHTIIISYNIQHYISARINTYDKESGQINITILAFEGTVSRISWFVSCQNV